MNLAEFTSGNIYVDVNIFYMFLRSDSVHTPIIRRFLERMADGDIQVHTSVLTMDELYYRLLLAQIKEDHQQSPLNVLRANTHDAVTRYAPPVITALRQLITLPNLHMVEIRPEDGLKMLENSRLGLLPRDALHLAVMQRFALSAIATDDTDFDHIPGLQRYGVLHAEN